MAISPEPISANPINFRAPPPSPIGTGRRSCVTNDDVLTEFLEQSIRVPDLILPDSIFPKQKFIENPPRIDFQSLCCAESDAVLSVSESMVSIGCFQLVNHGVPSDFIRSVMNAAAAGVFRVSPEDKMTVMRSRDKAYGFEEYCYGDEESEEFVWSRDESLKMEMEAISPFEYSNFSRKMETLAEKIEKMGEKILEIFRENPPRKSELKKIGSTCCLLYKHRQRANSHESLTYDIIRMLIRETDFSHALCFNICNGSSEFHVYSKRGWVSFKPDRHAIIVTLGDRIQEWSDGKYKHVIGKPIYRDDKGENLSMAFLYSPNGKQTPNIQIQTTISLTHQLFFFLFFTLLYNFLVYIFNP